MVLMLLSTLPPPSYSAQTGNSASPLSPCSNPFSSSFAAFLKPIFADNIEDIDPLINSMSTTTTTAMGHNPSSGDSKPSFTYPWLKPSPLSLKTRARKKALPPLPSAPGDVRSKYSQAAPPPSTKQPRRASSPSRIDQPQTDRSERSLAASFGTSSQTRRARRSRYDTVPSVQLEAGQARSSSPIPIPSQPPSQSHSRSSSRHASPPRSGVSSRSGSPPGSNNTSPRLNPLPGNNISHSPSPSRTPPPPPLQGIAPAQAQGQPRGLPPFVSDQSATHQAAQQLPPFVSDQSATHSASKPQHQASSSVSSLSSTPQPPASARPAPPRRDSEEANKLDMSIALAGVELDMSGSSFTPSTASTSGSFGSFASSVSSIFDAPEPLRLSPSSAALPQSAWSSISSAGEGEGAVVGAIGAEGEAADGSMLVPIAIEMDLANLPQQQGPPPQGQLPQLPQTAMPALGSAAPNSNSNFSSNSAQSSNNNNSSNPSASATEESSGSGSGSERRALRSASQPENRGRFPPRKSSGSNSAGYAGQRRKISVSAGAREVGVLPSVSEA